MAYEKQTFTPGQTLTAAQMNHIEAGVEALDKGKLDAAALPAAVEDALAQAKAGGEFDGEDGVSPVVSVSKSGGVTTVTFTDAEGEKTATINDGEDGRTPVKGEDYVDGEDGVSPVVSVSKSGGVTTISITDVNGTKTANVNDGSDGSPGSDGADGTSVTVASVSESTADGGSNVVTFSDGKTLTVKNGAKGSTGAAGAPGSNGADGYTPVRGTDYWTEADQAAMLQDVLEALGSPVLGSVDEDNNIVLSGELSGGTYTLMYENADGSRVTVGSLTIEESSGGEDVPAYTNLVPTAEAYDSAEPYNGTGYKDGYYLSGSAPYEGTDADCVLTGYIPYTVPATGVPGTIYISGAEVQSVSHCRIYFFGSTKVMSGNGVQGTVMSTYFTIETLSSGVTKLTPIASGDTSMLVADSKANTSTVYFRTSLIGTGENLIITVDEPIE